MPLSIPQQPAAQIIPLEVSADIFTEDPFIPGDSVFVLAAGSFIYNDTIPILNIEEIFEANVFRQSTISEYLTSATLTDDTCSVCGAPLATDMYTTTILIPGTIILDNGFLYIMLDPDESNYIGICDDCEMNIFG